MQSLIFGRDSTGSDLQDLYSDTDFRNPNYRVVSAFFSGFVFWGSMRYLLCSPFTHYTMRCAIGRISRSLSRRQFYRGKLFRSDPESQKLREDAALSESGNRTSIVESIFRRQDNPILVFILTLLFFMASLSQFTSTLVTYRFDTKDPSGRELGICAFLTAWDGMSFQTARLVGLIVLGLNLSSLGVKKMETIAFWLFVGIISILIVVVNALQPGILIPRNYMFKSSDDQIVALCYRQHILGASLALSLVATSMDIYSIARLLSIIAPPSFPLRRRLDALRDMRIVRGISLLVFDLIVLVPTGIPMNLLGDSLPFSVAAMIVLITFNEYRSSLRLYHDVPEYRERTVRPQSDPERLVHFRTLLSSSHPYSAAGVAASSSQSDAQPVSDYSGLTTTSRSDQRLLFQPVVPRAPTIVSSINRNKMLPPRPPLPPIPAERPPVVRRRPRSRSSSTSRPGSRKTQASNRSQKLNPVRPIVPRAELARQFDASERSADLQGGGVLLPPPTYKGNRIHSAPPQTVPPMMMYPGESGTRPHSGVESTAHTLGSYSIHYGSDILRPHSGSGRPIWDKMRVSVGTRATTPATTRTRPSSHYEKTGDSTGVPEHEDEWSPSASSWISDRTIDAYTVVRLFPADPSMPTFKGGWPAPPSGIPTFDVLSHRRRRPSESSRSNDLKTTRKSGMPKPVPDVKAKEPLSPASSRLTRAPSVQGPRKQPLKRKSRS